MNIQEGNNERQPTFKQQWVLTLANDNLLYTGVLWTHNFSPFRAENDCVIKAFLRRMEKSGWLSQETNPAFYRVTAKALRWKQQNRDKDATWYDSIRDRKWKEKSKSR